jgi:hypothetical protein
MIVRLLRLVGRMAFRFPQSTLTTHHDRWLNFFNFRPVPSLD